jgi:hypothetical protein
VAFQRRKLLAMDRKDRAYLTAYYREDVQKLAQVLGRELPGWLQ